MSTELTETFAEIGTPANPFPGLRPFEFDESHLFFGRDGQSEQLISKLGREHFVAVVGTSGSGKSSLVRAGLLPALLGGFMTSTGSGWRVAILRPGNDPVGNLAQGLNAPGVFGSEIEENAAIQTAIAEATLRRGSLGLVDTVREAAMPENENLLVLVDQFEEIFRFARVSEGETYHNEAAAFVKLVLEASRQREIPIYVVLTMRSDYLGDCSQFWDLPEAINESQYLIPRLTRDQLREAITGPAAVGGGKITPRLVNRLLNDVGDDQDQLPVLQHLLMRVWDERKEMRLEIAVKDGERTLKKLHNEVHEGEAIDLCCYDAVGGMAEALSRHADEALKELPDDRHRQIAEKLFKGLTEKGEDSREIRRPMTLAEICAVTGASALESKTVIEAFRLPGRSFLMPPAQTPLDDNSLIDISHESLIRVWQQLRTWVDEEARSARSYRRLADTAALYNKGEEGLLRGPGLQAALDWRELNTPHRAWAERYHPEFDEAMIFLEKSRAAREAERKRTRLTLGSVIVFLVLIIVVVLVLLLTAIRERKQSTSRELAASAMSQLSIDPELSMLLAVEGMRVIHTEKAEEALRQALAESHLQSRTAVNFGVIKTAYLIPDRSFLVTISDARKANVWDVNTGALMTELNDGSPTNIVGFSHDGDIVAVASEDGAAMLFEAASRKLLAELPHTAPVLYAVFSRDNNLLVTTTNNGIAQVWDWKTDKTKSIATLIEEPGEFGLKHTLSVSGMAFSPDGMKVVIIDNAVNAVTDERKPTARVWNWKSKAENSPVVLKGHVDQIKTAEFNPAGNLIATASDDGTAGVWDAKTGDIMKDLLGHEGPVKAAQFSEDGEWVLTRSSDGTARVWEASTGRVVTELRGHTGPVRSAVFMSDKRTIMTVGEDETVRVWRVCTEQESTAPLTHADGVFTAVFSPDGKLAITASKDNTARIWDARTGQSVGEPLIHPTWVTDAMFSPDSKFVVTSCFDKSTRVWEASTGRPVCSMVHDGPVTSAVFSPDGKLVLTASKDATARIWDAGTGESVNGPLIHREAVTSARFSPDGKLVVTASLDGTARVWDVKTGNLLIELTHGRPRLLPITSAMFSPDGKLVLTAGEDGTARIWEASTGREMVQLVGHTDAVDYAEFSPDGELVVTASRDRTARLWQARTGDVRAEFRGHRDWVFKAAFSGDGKFVVTASKDHTAQVWHSESGIKVARLLGHTDAVNSAAFDATGKLIITAGEDHTARIYKCNVCDSNEGILDLASRRVTRTLTSQERQRYLHEPQKK